MKTLLVILFAVLLAVTTNGFLTAQHHNLFNVRYEACKAKLIAENNYQSNEQAFACVKESTALRILGTILFSDGSYLEELQ